MGRYDHVRIVDPAEAFGKLPQAHGDRLCACGEKALKVLELMLCVDGVLFVCEVCGIRLLTEMMQNCGIVPLNKLT